MARAAIADPEVALVAACCRWPRDGAATAETERLVTAGVDGARLLRVVRRHRVDGLVHEALRPCADRIDAATMETLREAADAVRRRSLELTAESLRLHALLDAAGIRHLFVKGEALGQLAFGRLGLKSAHGAGRCRAPEDFERVRTCMTDAGYDQIAPSPRLTDADRRLWLRVQKDSVWVHRESGTVAELHHRLTLNPRLLPGISAASPALPVAVARGRRLPILNLTDHYVYLCVHGALSGWARLKWLADLGALLSAPGAPPVSALHAAAERQGVGGTSRLALILLERLFGRTLAIAGRVDSAVARAADETIAAMVGERGEREQTQGVIGGLRIQAAVRHLTSVRGQRRALLPLAAVSFRDRAALRLPRALAPLYWLIRMPSLLGRGLLGRMR